MAMNGLPGVVTRSGRSPLLYNTVLREIRGFHLMERRSRRCCAVDAVAAAKFIKIPACQLPIQAVNSLRLARPSRIGENAAAPGREHCQRLIYARF